MNDERKLSLTEEHTFIEKIPVMKVRHAAEVFSNTVVNFIDSAARNRSKLSKVIFVVFIVFQNLAIVD